MKEQLEKITQFFEAFGDKVLGTPTLPSLKVQTLRAHLIAEEAKETVEAIADGDLIGIADGLADLLYVTLGAALAYGIPINDVFNEVHRSNMTKLGAKRDPITGKVLKPATYSPPEIESILVAAGMRVTMP